MQIIEQGRRVEAAHWLLDRLLRGATGDAEATADIERLDALERVCGVWAAASEAEREAASRWVQRRGRHKMVVISLPGCRRVRMSWHKGEALVAVLGEPDADH